MQSDSDTVHLRRTITLKEDKFRLDSKHISKREVCFSTLLHSAASFECSLWLLIRRTFAYAGCVGRYDEQARMDTCQATGI